MKKHPNDEPVPLHTALWLENHERIDAMLKPWRYKTADEAAEAWNRRNI